MEISLRDKSFLNVISKLTEGKKITFDSGDYILEYKFSKPSHFAFHQRIFPAGVILKKLNSNVRIFIEAEKLNMAVKETDHKKFDDKQKDNNGKFKKAERGLTRNKIIAKEQYNAGKIIKHETTKPRARMDRSL